MGVMDFIKEAGHKVGLPTGGSGEAPADAGSAAPPAESAPAPEPQAASDDAAAEFQKRVEEQLAAAQAAQAAAAAVQLAEDQKSTELETYITGLGFAVTNLDVRFHEGVATVAGQVADQATKEKVILAIGNSAGVAQVQDTIEVVAPPAPEAPAEAPAPEPEAQMYVVVKGDTLSKIARNFYGDASKYPVIFEANQPPMTDPDKIFVGQVLRIPPQ